MKTLLIDDEPFMLELLTRQLRNLGIKAISSHQRAYDALAVLQHDLNGIELVFCDLQMPHIDGVEFVRHLADIGYPGGLVLMSGEDNRVLQAAERLAKAHNLNIVGILRKPVSMDHLRALLACKLANTAKAESLASTTYTAEELQKAITDGNLVNYYQPKVDLASGAVLGVETLVRWQHPQDGLISPDQFIPIAEEHDLIDHLTLTVLTAALHQGGQWRAAGLDLQIAVNVSMHNLVTLEFPDLVEQAVRAARLPLSNLILEVTESRLMSDPLASLDILARLRLKHIGLSIDDFGTGHSSLVQLRDIPFNELKVDRGFVHGACHDASLRAIFEASLSMGRQLGMKIVAEGVEDDADWAFLRASGCDVAQGYYIAKPMPAGQLFSWLNKWEKRRKEIVTEDNPLFNTTVDA